MFYLFFITIFTISTLTLEIFFLKSIKYLHTSYFSFYRKCNLFLDFKIRVLIAVYNNNFFIWFSNLNLNYIRISCLITLIFWILN